MEPPAQQVGLALSDDAPSLQGFSDHLTDETARPNAPVGAVAGGGRSGPAAAAAIARVRSLRPMSGPRPTQTGRADNQVASSETASGSTTVG